MLKPPEVRVPLQFGPASELVTIEFVIVSPPVLVRFAPVGALLEANVTLVNVADPSVDAAFARPAPPATPARPAVAVATPPWELPGPVAPLVAARVPGEVSAVAGAPLTVLLRRFRVPAL